MSFSPDNPPPPPPDNLPSGWSCLRTAAGIEYRDETGSPLIVPPTATSSNSDPSQPTSTANRRVEDWIAALPTQPTAFLGPSEREAQKPPKPPSLKRRRDSLPYSISPPHKKIPGRLGWTLSKAAVPDLTPELQASRNGLQILTIVQKLLDDLRLLWPRLTGNLQNASHMCVSFRCDELHRVIIGWEENISSVYLEDSQENRTPFDVFDPDGRAALLEKLRRCYFESLEEPLDEEHIKRSPPNSGFKYAAKRTCSRPANRAKRRTLSRGLTPLKRSIDAVE